MKDRKFAEKIIEKIKKGETVYFCPRCGLVEKVVRTDCIKAEVDVLNNKTLREEERWVSVIECCRCGMHAIDIDNKKTLAWNLFGFILEKPNAEVERIVYDELIKDEKVREFLKKHKLNSIVEFIKTVANDWDIDMYDIILTSEVISRFPKDSLNVIKEKLEQWNSRISKLNKLVEFLEHNEEPTPYEVQECLKKIAPKITYTEFDDYY